MIDSFPTDYQSVLMAIDAIDPIAYAANRNYVDGNVTYLSPYISRGVISTRFVLNKVMQKGYRLKDIESFVKELCWRDFFQRVQQVCDLESDLKQPQAPVRGMDIPVAIVQGCTGIEGIDHSIRELYRTGYMHNHCRMYTAFLTCNCAQIHWRLPAKWMYYYLIDGDWASNASSWQWVAGANSSKKYIANQENINRYTRTNQTHTFLDVPYESLLNDSIPEVLLETQSLELTTVLPNAEPLSIIPEAPVFIYNYYNLDPNWHKDELGNRILLLEPDFFATYPVSERCIDFTIKLAKNIPGIQVYVGSFDSLVKKCQSSVPHFKEHPFNKHYRGKEEPRDWVVPEVIGYFPSFFSFWKKIEGHIYSQYESFYEGTS